MSGTDSGKPVDSDPNALAKSAYRVLLVEREKALTNLLGLVLKDERVAVTGASSVYEAIGQLHAQQFDLVLFNAFEFLPDPFGPARPVRNAAKGTSVVLFTGYPVKRETAVADGFADVIAHPIDIDTLTAKVLAFLSPGRQSESAAAVLEDPSN